MALFYFEIMLFLFGVKKIILLLYAIVLLIHVHFSVSLKIFLVCEIQNYLNHGMQPHESSQSNLHQKVIHF